MRKLWCLLMLLAVMPAQAGTPAQAKAVMSAYERDMEAWQIRLKLAKTQDEREKANATHPRKDQAAMRMWQVISRQLDQEWTIEPAAWFLRIAGPLVEIGDDGLPRPGMRKEIAQVQQAVSKSHIRSKKLAPMCMGLVACGDAPSLKLLRRIEKENPDKKVSGVAALGVAMLGKEMSDEPRIMRERLTMLRKAIIEASDVTVDGVSVAKLAEEELYIIMNLTKGQKAPDLEGVDSGGRPMSLSSYEGKVLMLLFWNSAVEDPEAVKRWAKALRADPRFAGGNFELVGVSSDPRDTLRKLQMDAQVEWPNFSDPLNELGKTYRVGTWPLVYVLGPDRKIHFIGSIGTFAEVTAAAVLDEEG